MFEIDRVDYSILTAFCDEDIILNRPVDGMTISEIMEYLEQLNIKKCKKTIYLHLQKLVKANYMSKGIINNHADTYYISNKGQQALKGELG
jgi:DNA-binding PadR family transcriptional regulator